MTWLLCIIVGLVCIAIVVAVFIGLIHLTDGFSVPRLIKKVATSLLVCLLGAYLILCSYVLGCKILYEYGLCESCNLEKTDK